MSVKYRDVLNEVQPHYAIAAAAIAALAAGASAYASSRNQAKAKRNSANAAQMANQGGAGGAFGATANKFMDKGNDVGVDIEKRLSEISQGQQQPKPAGPQAAPTPSTAPAPTGSTAPTYDPMEEERKRRMMQGGY